MAFKKHVVIQDNCWDGKKGYCLQRAIELACRGPYHWRLWSDETNHHQGILVPEEAHGHFSSCYFCSVAYLCLTLCNPMNWQHARILCPSPSPRACSNSCPSSWWGHPTISSSVVPFSSCPQPFLVSRSFLMSLFFASGGQSIGASASASLLLMNIQDWFPLRLTCLSHHKEGWALSLEKGKDGRVKWRPAFLTNPGRLLKGLSRVCPNTKSSKASILWCSAFFMVQLSHPYMTTGKTITLTRQTSVCKVMSLLFNMLTRFVIAFLPRGKHLLIPWLQSPSTVIMKPPKIKSVTFSIVSFCIHV